MLNHQQHKTAMETNENNILNPNLSPESLEGQTFSDITFNLDEPEFVGDDAMIDDPSVNEENHPYFIEGPANSYTYADLQKMVIPVFAASNELSLANTDIAKAVYSAAAKCFGLENLSPLEFRGSHLRKSRIISAETLKMTNNDVEAGDTNSYLERLACCFTVKNYARTIADQPTDLCIGFVRSYTSTNLYSTKAPEKLSIWCSTRVRVCSNLCLSVSGLKEEISVLSPLDVYKETEDLIQSYLRTVDEENKVLEGLCSTRITTTQFKLLTGSLRYYMSLDLQQRKELPEMDIQLGDAQTFEACRLFINSKWGLREGEDSIDLFRLLNCYTEAVKNSYLHNFLPKQRSVYTMIKNLQMVLQGDTQNPYAWLLAA